MVSLLSITPEDFSPYGTIITLPQNSEEDWYIVDGDSQNPWRIAVFRFRNKEIIQLECHRDSKESFEPLSGVTVLLVASPQAPHQWKAFVLDKSVCLKKGVWHQVLSLTSDAQVKITENNEVSTEFYNLEKTVKVVVG